jgi:DNA polymerase-3 subunit gamma/tau
VQAADGPSEPTLLEQEKMAAEKVREAVLGTPVVRAAFDAFPDAELIHYSTDEQRSA